MATAVTLARLRAHFFWCVVIVSCASDLRCALSEDANAISTLTNTLKNLDTCEIRATVRESLSSTKLHFEGAADQPVAEDWGETSYLLRRQATRALLSELSPELPSVPDRYRIDRVLTGNELLYISDRVDADLQQVSGSDGLSVALSSASISGPAGRKTFRDVLEGLNDHAILFGFLGHFPIVEYCEDPREVAVTPLGDMIRVVTKSKLGDLQMLLDPHAGCLPRSFTLVKYGTHLASGGKQIDEINMNGNERIWPAGGIDRIVWSASDIHLAESAGVFYIEDIVLTQAVECLAGPIVTITTHANVEYIDYHPTLTDSDFSSQIKIPLRYPVTIEGAEYLPYRWDGAKATAAGNVVAFPSALTTEGESSRRSFWLTLISVNVVVAMILAALFFVGRIRNTE